MDKKRLVVDYKTLPDHILKALADKYPDGYDEDIIKFKNAKGELVKAVPIETDEAYYLVKVSVQLAEMVQDFDDEDDDDDFDDEISKSSNGYNGEDSDDEFDDDDDDSDDDDEEE
ncbi:hypothetical protein [Chondrinema litorale]|uniref:hypothetical protein n=1 Tax=Chondrinema litorale TaxID=2994555 RepID=UPI002543B5B7|nr:hypothetical protein [Chondrinema litorale]UZR95368.1 hypothetical protein OQ292_05985 [Chondrinema litorale]